MNRYMVEYSYIPFGSEMENCGAATIKAETASEAEKKVFKSYVEPELLDYGYYNRRSDEEMIKKSCYDFVTTLLN